MAELRVIKQEPDLIHVALAGRLDLLGVQSVEQTFGELTEKQGKATLVDMSEVVFLSSMGLRMFLKAAKALNRQGAKLVLLKPQAPVEETLMYVAFNNLIPIEHDPARALQILKGR